MEKTMENTTEIINAVNGIVDGNYNEAVLRIAIDHANNNGDYPMTDGDNKFLQPVIVGNETIAMITWDFSDRFEPYKIEIDENGQIANPWEDGVHGYEDGGCYDWDDLSCASIIRL